MPGGYGPSKNGVSIGVFWDGIDYEVDRARITDPRVTIKRSVTISDTSNNLSVEGGAVADNSWSNLNCSGKGEERIKEVSAQWIPRPYGSSTTVSFKATLTGINYAGGALGANKSVTVSARAYELPAAPTLGTCGRTSSTSTSEDIQLNWTNNPTGGTETSAPYSAVVVERLMDADATWAQASVDLAPATTSWVDTGAQAGHRYNYRIRAKNSTGTGVASAETGWIHSTPLPPSAVTVTKSGADIAVGWSAGTPYLSATIITPVRGGVPSVTTYSVAAGVNTWADPSESPLVTQQYGLQHAIFAVPLASGSTATILSAVASSSIVQPEGPPLAPTVSLQHAVIDATSMSITASWIHNPVDAAPQTAAQIGWRIAAGSWAIITKTTQTSHLFAAGTFSNGHTYEVQVRTQGAASPGYGPWSESATFTTSGRPTATIVAPVDGATLHTSLLVLDLSYSDPEAGAAQAWDVALLSGSDVELWSNHALPGTTGDDPFSIPYSLEDGETYKVSVRAQDPTGLWSTVDTHTYDVEFADPVAGTIIEAECLTDIGAVALTYVVPSPTPESVEAIRATVQRLTDGAWVNVCSMDFVDYEPPAESVNAFSNPGYEATSGATAEVRRNLIQNPAGTTSTGLIGWRLSSTATGGSGYAVTTSYPTSGMTLPGGPTISTFQRRTWTAVGASAPTAFSCQLTGNNGGRAAVVAGKTYTVSFAWRKSFGGSPNYNEMQVWFYDAITDGTTIGFIHGPTLTNPDADVVQRDSFTFTVPAGATHCTVEHYYSLPAAGTLVVGSTFDATAALAEELPSLAPWFSGEYSPSSDLTAAWVGASNASVSTLSGNVLSAMTADAGTQAVVVRAAAQKRSGSYSAAHHLRSTAAVDLTVGSVAPTPGSAYTLLVKVRSPRTLAATPQIGGTLGAPVTLPASTWTEVRVAVTAGSGGSALTGIHLDGGAGHLGGEIVYMDEALLIPGDYTGPWFEGIPLSCMDRIPPLGQGNTYRVATESTIPTYTIGPEFSVDCSTTVSECRYPDGMILFLNATADATLDDPDPEPWAEQARIIGDPAVQATVEREKVLATPVGRTYAVEFRGLEVDETYAISGVVARDDLVGTYLAGLGATREQWEAMALHPAPLCYRDPFGRRVFCSIGAVRTDWGTTPVSAVSATLTRVAGGEG